MTSVKPNANQPRCRPFVCVGGLLDTAFLISSRPFETSGITIQVYMILPSLRVLEPQNCTVPSNKHDSCPRLYFFSGETADSRLGH